MVVSEREVPAVVNEREAPAGNAQEQDLLEQRIEQAIQPVIADFQQHVAELVEQRLASAQLGEQTDCHNEEESESGESSPDSKTDEVASRNASAPAVLDESTQTEDDEAERSDSREADDDTEDEHATGITPVLRHALVALEQEGNQWLRTLLTLGIDALFSSPVRTAIQGQLQESVQDLLADVFSGFTSDDESSRALRKRTEATTQHLLDDMLTEIFEGSVRTEVQLHAEEAIEALTRLDLDVAAHHGQEALEALLLGMVRALGRHWGELIRLLLKVVVKVLQESVSSTAVAGIAKAVDSSEEAKEKGEELQEKAKEKTQELGDKLREASETLRQRVQEESEGVRKRIKEGVENGGRDRQLGRPPSGGPLGKPPSGRAPSGSRQLGRAPGAAAPGRRNRST